MSRVYILTLVALSIITIIVDTWLFIPHMADGLQAIMTFLLVGALIGLWEGVEGKHRNRLPRTSMLRTAAMVLLVSIGIVAFKAPNLTGFVYITPVAMLNMLLAAFVPLGFFIRFKSPDG